MRAARGDGRTQAMRKLALGHMWAAEAGGSPRDVRRHRHDADEQARDVVERSDDRAVQAEMSFVQIWDAWRGERPNASRLAERFVARHSDAGELVPVVWIIRGEIALEAEQYQEAEAAYRFLLGELEHPFYPLALYRTAACYRGMHRADDAKQALREVDQIGRRRNATPLAKKLGEAARRELGLPPPEQQAKKD